MAPGYPPSSAVNMDEETSLPAAAAAPPGATQPESRSWRERLTPTGRKRLPVRMFLIALSLAITYVLWIIGAHHFASYILPHPHAVWASFKDTWDRGVWTQEVLQTLKHMAIAFALILGIGLPLGIIIGRLWVVEDLTRILLIFLQTVPTIVLIALALIFIGIDATGVEVVTIASGLTYFTLNVIQGTKSIDHDLIEMGRAYGAREATLMRSIILPSVVPYFLAGARITLGVVWQVTLFAEYLMGTPGVGFQISSAIKLLDTAAVFSWGLSIVALTIAFEYGVFRPAEAFLTRHTRRD